jgi:hypothetical protein
LDGWAHEIVKVLDTFFTPWHAIYYSGFAAVSLFLCGDILYNFSQRKKLARSLRTKYASAYIGVLIFSAGGLGDVIWHEFFGFERSIDALMSPTHLGLYLGMFLIFSAPFKNLIYQKNNKLNFKSNLTLILSITIIFSFLTFFTQYINPLISPFAFNTHQTPYRFYHEAIGLASLFVHTIFLLAPLLMTLVHKKIPLGGLSTIILLNALSMTSIHLHFDFLIAAVLISICSEALLHLTRPSLRNPFGFQVFSYLLPFVYAGFYFLVGSYSRGIGWSSQLWIGTVLVSGFFGWLLSYLMLSVKYQTAD